MGGCLTVSSREHFGSTFTFILPYKVSNMCDSSDDAEEISDMANHDAPSEDVTESYFQFQPRTLGSLFNSNGSSRTSKLLSHKIGYTSSHKLNGLPHNSYSFPLSNGSQQETVSIEDACSSVSVAETSSKPETSESHTMNPDNGKRGFGGEQCQDNTSNQLPSPRSETPHKSEATRDMDVSPRTSETQSTSQRHEKSDATSEKNSRTSTEVPKSTSEPKILLVEDNKINVMVTQSMMKQLGHTIDVVNNGVEAIRAVQRRSYGLVLMVLSEFFKCFDFLVFVSNCRS